MSKFTENLCEATNQILIETFKRNIVKEKAQIAFLVKEEKNLNKKIDADEKRIKKGKLLRESIKLGQLIKKYKSEVTILKKKINEKERMLRHFDEAYQMLKSDIQNQKELNKKVDKKLHNDLDKLSRCSVGKSVIDFKKFNLSKIKSLTVNLAKKKEIVENVSKLEQKRISGKLSSIRIVSNSKKLNKKLDYIGKLLDSVLAKREKVAKVFVQKNDHIKELADVIRERLEKSMEQKTIENEMQMVTRMICGKNPDGFKSNVNVSDKKEMKQFLRQIDRHLGKMPSKDIDKFAKSKDFVLYGKVMKKYGLK